MLKPVDAQEIAAAVTRDGYVHLRSALSPEFVNRFRRESLAVLKTGQPGRRGWAPMTSSVFAASELWRSPSMLALAAAYLGSHFFGVMCDAYLNRGSAGLHSDSHTPILVGIRINFYPVPLLPGKGALTVFPGTHREEGFLEMSEASAARIRPGRTGRTLAVEPGDMLVMDLRLWHEVVSDDTPRLFGSLFYYQMPQSPPAEAAVRWCAARNRRAPAAFRRPPGDLYAPSFIAATDDPVRQWLGPLQTYDFLD